MAKPIPHLQDITNLSEEIKPKETKSFIDITVDTIRTKSTKYLVLGTITARPRTPSEELKPAVIQKPEPYKPDEPFDKPFLPAKPIPHPLKISLSSIPNPSPSVTANMETGYHNIPNYSGFLYNIPGYSAFQPVNYSRNHPPSTPMHTETSKPDFKPFTISDTREVKEPENIFERREENVFARREENVFARREENVFARREENVFARIEENVFARDDRREEETIERKEVDTPKQQDFEDNFTIKIIPPTSKQDAVNNQTESKMSITSLAQGSGGSVTIPSQINKDIKKKPERYSLKTSIPISKIDMKCVSSPVDTAFQNAIKKPVFNPAFQKETERPKVEIQSNIIIKTATINKETEVKDKPLADRESLRQNKLFNTPVAQNNTISTLINAAEAINKGDGQFRVPEPKVDTPIEVKDFPVPQPALIQRPMFIPKDVVPVTSQPTSILRSMFNTVSAEANKLNSTQPTSITRPMFNPVSTEGIQPSLTQTSAVQRPMFTQASTEVSKTNLIFNPVSADENKPNISQPSGTLRPMFNPVSAEANKLNPAQPAAIQRPMFNPVNTEASKSNSIQPAAAQRSMFKPASAESNKPNFSNKPPDEGFNEQQNLMFLQKQKQNPKMLLTIQPNPQVLLQRTNFESKNLQAPSRLSSQSKKSEVIAESSSKVVALKRLHQDNCDENDFENLITENQIYGNKIVVKEKSQATQDEWKNKVKVEKQVGQDWNNKLKIDVKVDKPPESKNVSLQPNFVYLSNVQFPANLMMIKNSSKICQTTDSTKIKVSPIENRTTEVNIVTNNNIETNHIVKNPKPQNIVVNKEVHVKSRNNLLQTLLNSKKKKVVAQKTNQKVNVTPQVVYQVPIVATVADTKDQAIYEPKAPIVQKKEPPKQIETKPEKVIITCQVDAKDKVPMIVITNLRPKVKKEFSMLDLYEKKKRLRRLKYLSATNKGVPKVDLPPPAKKVGSKSAIDVITPDKVNAEILNEFSQTKEKRKEESSESESDSDEDVLEEYNAIIERFGPNYNENAKADFLVNLNLATMQVFREKQLERHERTLKFDAIASAYIAAGRLDPDMEDQPSPSAEPQNLETALEAEDKSTMRKKHQFLSHFKLMKVSPSYKADYEKSWQEIVRERNRRYGITHPEPFDPDSQLQMLTEINKSVNENNDLIKKRLDSICDENSDIRILAEKNFSELSRLSKMADRSVKLFSGKDTKKRDLNPGFDSENIKKFKVDLPKLNIPNISNIISLKTDQESGPMSSSQATSMDEPSNSASCGQTMTSEVGCQANEKVPWQAVIDVMDNFVQNYRKYEIARKKETDGLHHSNTRLRVASAHVTRAASRDADHASALLAERQLLAAEETKLRTSLERLNKAIKAVKNS